MAIDLIARGMANSALENSDTAIERVDQLPNGIHFVGAVDSVSDLPASADLGDTYIISGVGSQYTWGVKDEEEQWIENGRQLADVAKTGSYNDLLDKPEVPEYLASKEYVDNAVAGKQDELTAGANIQIRNNIISATGGGGGITEDGKTIIINEAGYAETAVGGYIDEETGNAVPISADFIPVDGETIVVNEDGELEAVAQGSSISADGITIINDDGVLSTAIGGGMDGSTVIPIGSEFIPIDGTTITLDDDDNLMAVIPTNISAFNNNLGYQTLSDVQDILTDYQPRLTAGQNITIDANNVISASGGGSGKTLVVFSSSNVNDFATVWNSIYSDLENANDYDIYYQSDNESLYKVTGVQKDATDKRIGFSAIYARVSSGGVPTLLDIVVRYSMASWCCSVSNRNLQVYLRASNNINLTSDGWISAVDTTYTAGEGIEIDENNVISASGGSGASYTGENGIIIDKDSIIMIDDEIMSEDEKELYFNDGELELIPNEQVFLPDFPGEDFDKFQGKKIVIEVMPNDAEESLRMNCYCEDFFGKTVIAGPIESWLDYIDCSTGEIIVREELTITYLRLFKKNYAVNPGVIPTGFGLENNGKEITVSRDVLQRGWDVITAVEGEELDFFPEQENVLPDFPVAEFFDKGPEFFNLVFAGQGGGEAFGVRKVNTPGGFALVLDGRGPNWFDSITCDDGLIHVNNERHFTEYALRVENIHYDVNKIPVDWGTIQVNDKGQLSAVGARIPDAPSEDGTYVLKATVTDGVPTYNWISE